MSVPIAAVYSPRHVKYNFIRRILKYDYKSRVR